MKIQLPRKINVVGTSGSGKSTFSQRLAKVLGHPYIEIDKIFWGPNWYWPSDEEFFAKLKAALKQDSWVLDGNYDRTVPIKWENVEMVIWLDYPFARTLFRALKRAIRRSLTREEIWEGTGNRESFRKSFFSKDSIVLWTIKTHARVRRRYEAYMTDPRFSHIKFVRLRNDQDLEHCLANLNLNWRPLSVEELRRTLAHLKCDWAIAGGWAIDLFLDRETRRHDDIDIIIKRDDQFLLQKALKDWELWVADPPGTLRPWKKGEYIGQGLQDIWCRRSTNDPWQIQVMLYDVQDGQWVFKRNANIRCELGATIVNSRAGIRILAPEIQLLYKSKLLRDKDQADFEAALPALNESQKKWLREALITVYQGQHEWILNLSE